MKNLFKRLFKKTTINFSVSHPLFSESILQTNFYNELQKNGWCKIVADKPESLMELVEIKEKKRNIQK